MPQINSLLDRDFAIKFLSKKILAIYSDFAKVQDLKITPIKKNIWEGSYHVVIKFDFKLAKSSGEIKSLPIYCSAHSHEPRNVFYTNLKFLWQHGFADETLSIPRPLFYSRSFKAVFYRGVAGKNLFYYIRHRQFTEVEKIVAQAGAWFAKLHKIPTRGLRNSNSKNSRIKTVVPGQDFVLERIKQNYPDKLELFQELYKKFIETETDFFKTTKQRWLIHGDAHPENIIKMSDQKIAVIDFADMCLADYARDLGSFLQQLDHMMVIRSNIEVKYAVQAKAIFLQSYLEKSKINLDKKLQSRIDLYYAFAAFRTAIMYLLRHNPAPEKAEGLLEIVRKKIL